MSYNRMLFLYMYLNEQSESHTKGDRGSEIYTGDLRWNEKLLTTEDFVLARLGTKPAPENQERLPHPVLARGSPST